ncbi:MAG: 2-isopropylmalate synthase [Candidatus Margulisbacteria bacterium GWF2_35_9]|nr:MAG: 2-isopropylmalate synthase [Candidatus Margulisbacteria bacterium GWF2_35_9]
MNIINGKYKKYETVSLPDRKWPDKEIQFHPIWCSVDLRDGNQALITPMTLEEKIKYFNMLIEIGFKEIEVGFPSASQIEFDFMRYIIDHNLIPKDVSIQVLVQSREELIKRTFEAIKGANKPIVHLYNSTSTNQRKIVFQKNMSEIIDIAIHGVRWIKQCEQIFNTPVILEYSPESFTGTEINNALDICNAVIKEWNPDKENKMIINLPATVEISTPNVYADQIEWMGRYLTNRESVILSVHAHNDRGSAVAATELALLAGAERVEGTLFGNGERTGNVDLITLAINMMTHGINPGLKINNINKIKEMVESINKLPVSERHPYAGSLVFTAFSGSHQDAINKGLKYMEKSDDPYWEVPYLPIDPKDIGRTYEGIIRINSQSGKGGVAYILEQNFGYMVPKSMQPIISKSIQSETDKQGIELSPEEIKAIFCKKYVNTSHPIGFVSYSISTCEHEVSCELKLNYYGEEHIVKGVGNGSLDASKMAIQNLVNMSDMEIENYVGHAKTEGSKSLAVTYVEMTRSSGSKFIGVGEDNDITVAAIKALISAVNAMIM